MKFYLIKNNILIFTGIIFILVSFFNISNYVFAFDTYYPLESITLGEFIYNDDYTPTADDCQITIYSPSLDIQVNNVTMNDEGTSAQTGWHYYTYTTLNEEGKYPAFITCGSELTGDLFKLDKSFIVKAPEVTSEDISSAITTINSNVDSKTSSLTSTLLSLPSEIWNYSARTLSSIGSFASEIATEVWSSPSRSLTMFGTLVDDIWSNTTRTLTSGGDSLTAADIWSYGTRNLTDGTLSSGSLATYSDINNATSNLVTTTQLSTALSPLATTEMLALVKQKTDTIDWSDIASIKGNVDILISEVGVGNIAGIKTKTDTINWLDVTSIKNNSDTLISEIGVGNILDIKTKTDTIAWADITGIVSSSGLIKEKTDTISWSDVTGIKTKTDTIAWNDVTGIKTKTDTIAWADITGIVSSSGLIKEKTDTISWSDVTGIKTKTDTIAWNDVTGIKTKTDTILWSDISLLAKTTDVSSAVENINSNTNTQLASSVEEINTNTNAGVSTLSSLIGNIPANVWSYTSRSLTSFGTLVNDIWDNVTRTLTSEPQVSNSWSVNMSDFSTITAGSYYLATFHTIYNGNLTDSLNIPTITIYDSNRNVVVSSVEMTRTSVGTYGYSYLTNQSAGAGVWESIVSATVEEGKTLPGNDYWNVTTTPAQVIINNITDNTVPDISANITVTNEGLSGNEYQYEWCVVTSANNNCGGNDDVFHAVAAKYINPGEDFNTNLTATVPNLGTYFFKIIVYFGTDSSVASRSFTAVASSGGSGGGGGGSATVDNSEKCKRADFNCDKKINSIDFSILLYYWKSIYPFKNKTVDVNKDNKVDSIDFSILLYEWGKNY